MDLPQVPVVRGQNRIMGTATPGQRPGDGQPLSDGNANRSLLDRELFANYGDGLIIMNGAPLLFGTSAANLAAAQAAAQSATSVGVGMLAWLLSIPTNPLQGIPGWWNNGGVPTYGAGA